MENTGKPSSSSADNTINKAAAGAHGAVDRVASAADEAAQRAKPAIERVAQYAHQAVDRATGAASPTAEWLSEQAESLKATQEKMLDDTCKYVSANPLKSLAIALVAGAVISRIIR